MEEIKLISDSILRLTDTTIKLSTALLVVPITFLKFVSEQGPIAHPDALFGIHLISSCLKLGIFISFGISIVLGLFTQHAVANTLSRIVVTPDAKFPKYIFWVTQASGTFFVIGTIFLMYLFFQFPIEIPEPFRIGFTPLG